MANSNFNGQPASQPAGQPENFSLLLSGSLAARLDISGVQCYVLLASVWVVGADKPVRQENQKQQQQPPLVLGLASSPVGVTTQTR